MAAPLITMSAVTGKPTRDEIFSYMRGLKNNGIDKAMVYPRSGCELDYLEDEWFNAVSHYIDAAKELDMKLWLYDDFNWPSGDAHGRVSKMPEYRLKAICTKGEKLGEIDFYSKNKGSLFNEKYFPDLLNDKAMDYFIECTHENYYRHFGEYFGNIIEGIFTDEPGVGYCCTEESMPYYEGMAEDYKNVSSRDFLEDLKSGHEDFYKICLKLVGERFRSCFAGKIAKWCENHGVALTGHLMEDTTPHGATKQCGDILKALSCFTIPGVDELRTRFDDLCIYNLLGTVQYARRNKKGAMAELFALGPCDISYANKRCIMYLCSCFGINNYFLAVSHLDLRGNMAITDYFNDFSADVPDFSGVKELAKEAGKAALLAEKTFTPKLYIRYPTQQCAKNLFGEINLMKFFKLVNKLTDSQIQWKYADENDNFTDAPILELTEELDYVMDGEIVSMEWVLERFGTKPCVTNLDGSINGGIFVRKYDDGTTVVLNTYGEKGWYLADGKKIYLEEKGVLVFEGEACETQTVEKIKADATFDVKYHGDNMIRAMYVNDADITKVVCDEETAVTFAVRNECKCTVNGNEVDCPHKESDVLPFGFKKLYNVSDKVILGKGKNDVVSGADKKYLPAVFMIGDFSCRSTGGKTCVVELEKRSKTYKTGDTLQDFGKVELITEITLPENAKAVVLEGASLVSEVYVDDEYCGMCVYAPYRFEIPENKRGKTVKLSVVQTSSLGPVFGDVEYYTQNSSDTNWITPSPKSTCYGMEEMNFEI